MRNFQKTSQQIQKVYKIQVQDMRVKIEDIQRYQDVVFSLKRGRMLEHYFSENVMLRFEL